MPIRVSTSPRRHRFSFVLALAATAIAAAGCAMDGDPAESEDVGEARQAVAVWPDHATKAGTYVGHMVGHETSNIYGSGGTLTFGAGDVLTAANTRCATFTSLLLQHVYPGITTTVLQQLVGSTSPFAEDYYDYINPGAPQPSNPTSDISLLTLDSAVVSPAVATGRTLRSGATTYLQVGDILASKYNLYNAAGTVITSTGHVMTVGAIESAPDLGAPGGGTMTLSGNKAIPGVTSVRRWSVMVYDSTSSVHGTVTGTYADSRYGTDATEGGNDTGVGSGFIYLYEDATTGSATLGQLVGWTWSRASGYTFQFTDATKVDGNGATTHRPMVIGRFSGAGLDPQPAP